MDHLLSLIDKALEDAFLAGRHGPDSEHVANAAQSEQELRREVIARAASGGG